MATNIRNIATVTVSSGSANPATIPTTSLSNEASTYFLNIYSPSALVYLVPSGSADTVSGKPVFSGSAIQDGPYTVATGSLNLPDVYFPTASTSVYVTFVQVVSEGR